jgi:NAD(P)-dependent dehydrogenase (short-subunit alcohol dehydrogenase family)
MDARGFEGSVAVITGAANGIGAAVARRLASSGAQVVLADLDVAGGRAVADELGGIFVETDVRDLDANRALAQTALDTHGKIDLVHLNAGIPSRTGFGSGFDLDAYRRAMAVNFDGVVFGVQATIDTLVAQGSGQIIATASMAGLTPVPFDPIYGANKSAVVSLVRSLAGAYADAGVRINALCPSFADTDIITDIRQFLVDTKFPILEVDDVIATFMAIAESDGTGECWFVVPGRTSEPFGFRNVPGPRAR